jgi:hypothetical protein
LVFYFAAFASRFLGFASRAEAHLVCALAGKKELERRGLITPNLQLFTSDAGLLKLFRSLVSLTFNGYLNSL